MAISSTHVNLELTVCGVTREVEASVSYIHTRAFRGIFEKGGGQVSPDEPENAEIQTVRIQGSDKDDKKLYDVTHLLTDAQVDAISTEVLGQGR